MISFKTHKLIQESFGAFALGLARPNRIGGPIGSQFAEEEFGSETDDEDDEDDDSEESETEGDGDITSGGEPEGDFDFPPDNPEDGEDAEMGGEFGDEMGGEFGGDEFGDDMGDDEEMDPAMMMGMSGGDEFGGPNLDDLDAGGDEFGGDMGDDEEMDPAMMMGDEMGGMDGMPMPDDEMGVPPMGDDDEMGSMGMGDGGAGMDGGDDEIADLIGGIDPALLGDESEEDMGDADMEGGDLEGEMGDEMGDDEEVEDPNQMMAMMRSYMSSGKNKKFMNKDCGPNKKNCLPAKFMKKEDTGDDFLRSLASQARGNHKVKNKSGLRNEDSLLAPLNTIYDNEPKAGQVGHSPQQRIGGIGGGYQMSDFDLPTLGESTEKLPTIREYMEWKANYRKGRKS